INGVHELMNTVFKRGLVCGKRRLETVGVAAEHARHLAEAETELAQRHDLGSTGHLRRTIRAPAGRGADRRDQAALLVEPQSLRGNAKPHGGLGSIQKLRGSVHESPRNWLTATLSRQPQGPGQARNRQLSATSPA